MIEFKRRGINVVVTCLLKFENILVLVILSYIEKVKKFCINVFCFDLWNYKIMKGNCLNDVNCE